MFRSLKSRLIFTSLSLLTFAWLATLGAEFYLGQRALSAELDSELEQLASDLSRQVLIHHQTILRESRHGVEYQIIEDDQVVLASPHAPKEMLLGHDGFSQSEADNKKWRTFSIAEAGKRVAVGQDLRVRRSLVLGLLLSSIWPLLFALPLTGALLWFAIAYSLRPLDEMTEALRTRSPKDLKPLVLPALPRELEPVLSSLNRLLNKLASALEREKHFTDDAAHELNTPLAGIKAQTEAALRAGDEAEMRATLGAINSGVARASRVVSQLLTLARLEPEDANLRLEKLDLSQLLTRMIANYAPRALAAKIDIGLNAPQEVVIEGDATALEILFSNLLENALKFSKAQGRIEVELRATPEAVEVTIDDEGPGLRPDLRERVFERFARGPHEQSKPGSGIGLAIVQRIAELHQARVVLESASIGLRARVTLPKAPG